MRRRSGHFTVRAIQSGDGQPARSPSVVLIARARIGQSHSMEAVRPGGISASGETEREPLSVSAYGSHQRWTLGTLVFITLSNGIPRVGLYHGQYSLVLKNLAGRH